MGRANPGNKVRPYKLHLVEGADIQKFKAVSKDPVFQDIFKQMAFEQKRNEKEIERYLNVNDIVKLKNDSVLMQPDQLASLREDLVEVACRHEFGSQKDQGKRMWRAQKFKLGKALDALVSGNAIV